MKHAREAPIEDVGPWRTAVEIVGDKAAAQLSRDFAGRRVYVPATLTADHPLAVSVGHELALKLCKALAGSELAAPLTAGRDLRILELLAAGTRPERIGPIVGCSRSHVFRVKAAAEKRQAKDAQPRLI